MTTHDIPGLIAEIDAEIVASDSIGTECLSRFLGRIRAALAAEHERAESLALRHGVLQNIVDCADNCAGIKADRDALAAKLAEAERVSDLACEQANHLREERDALARQVGELAARIAAITDAKGAL